MKRDVVIVSTCLALMLAIYLFTRVDKLHETSVAKIKAAILASHRPRVVYFYSEGCPASQRYKPELKKTVDVYEKAIDWQLVNIYDPGYQELCDKLNIHSTPSEIIFDRNGRIVWAYSGTVDQASVNNALRRVYLETLNQPRSTTTQAAKR